MRVAVIGVGYWGPNIVRALVQLKQDVVVFDRRLGRMRLMEEVFAVSSVPRIEAIWGDHSIEAVCIAVPVPEHGPLLSAACRAGKHAFVEKPLCVSVAEADLLRRHLNGNVVMVGHITRFSAGLELLRQRLAAGDIGELRRFSLTRTHLGPVYSDTDVLTEVAAHDFAILLSLGLGRPARIIAWGVSRLGRSTCDIAHVVMIWPGGVVANVDVGWTSAVRQRVVVAEGTTGALVFDGSSGGERLALHRQRAALEVLRRGGPAGAAVELAGREDLAIDGSEPLIVELRDFLEAIEQRRRPRVDFEFGVSVVSLLEAARTSMLANGREVQLDAEALV